MLCGINRRRSREFRCLGCSSSQASRGLSLSFGSALPLSAQPPLYKPDASSICPVASCMRSAYSIRTALLERPRINLFDGSECHGIAV